MAPKSRAAFNYDTISDVVLHIRYTALSSQALTAAFERAKPAWPTDPSAVLLSCRSDFSQAWYQAGTQNGTADVELNSSLLPYSLALTNKGPKRILWMDIPADGEPNGWRAEAGPQATAWPRTVRVTGIQDLQDRLMLLEFE
jgi:hypothetical protein